MGKAVNLFRINLLSGNPREVLLAKYLKCDEEQRNGKEKVVMALDAFYGSISLSQSADVSPDRIHLAGIQDIAKLRNQIDYIIYYHRITNGIELTDRLENIPIEKIVADPIIEPLIQTLAPPVTDRNSEDDYNWSIFDNE